MTSADPKMMAQISGKPGFLAALDQSGGSTPGALKAYGIPESAFSGEDEMFRLIHETKALPRTFPCLRSCLGQHRLC